MNSRSLATASATKSVWRSTKSSSRSPTPRPSWTSPSAIRFSTSIPAAALVSPTIKAVTRKNSTSHLRQPSSSPAKALPSRENDDPRGPVPGLPWNPSDCLAKDCPPVHLSPGLIRKYPGTSFSGRRITYIECHLASGPQAASAALGAHAHGIVYQSAQPSSAQARPHAHVHGHHPYHPRFRRRGKHRRFQCSRGRLAETLALRSEEHTSELQSHVNLVCRLL